MRDFIVMPLPILYSFRRCPYAMRARLAIYSSGIAVELREVVLRDKPPAMLVCSPKATVPVLQLSSGDVIDESRDIIAWALSLHDPNDFLSVNLPEQNRLIDVNDGEFKKALDHYKYPNRYSSQYPQLSEHELMLKSRKEAEFFLQEIECLLTANIYLVSEQLSMADIAILPFIRQFASVDKIWFDAAPYPRLQAWLAEFLASDLFLAVMPKFSQWHEGDEPVVFKKK